MIGSMIPDDAGHPLQVAPPASGLHWRIKDSFVRYVLSGSTGAYAVTDGAEDDGDGNFYFPLASAEQDVDGVWRIAFEGDVRFSGHMGALFVRIAEVVVTIGPDGGELTIAGGGGGRIRIARLGGAEPHSLADAAVWPELKPALTADGVALFGDVYSIGEPLDPLRIVAIVD